MVVYRISFKCVFYTAGIAFACINHHTSESIVTCHNRQLLITYLHIESSKIPMDCIVEKIKMCPYLIIPTGFWLIFYSLFYFSIVIACVSYLIITAICLIGILI